MLPNNTEQDQFQVIDGKPYRKLFENVKYNDQQIKNIDRIKQYLKQKQPTKIYQQSFILKMIYLTSKTFNPLSVYENIKKHQQWFQNPSIASYRDQGGKIIESGAFYSYGRDLEYSPVIYFYPSKFDTSKYSITDYYNALFLLIQPIEQHMLIPGIIETFNVIIDMQDSTFPLPINILREMIQKVVFAYPFRLKRLFFVRTNPFNQVSKCIKQTLKNFNYHVKVQYIAKFEDFRKYIQQQERQIKYGGNLKDLQEFWPIPLSTKFQEEKSYFLIQNNSETDYKSVINQEAYFEGAEPNQGGCGSCGNNNCEIF